MALISRKHRISSAEGDHHHHHHKPKSFAAVDPAEGIETLPLYLRGGTPTDGFGDLLGDALALLYVARHGLKEYELWAILAGLQQQRETVANSQVMQ